MFRASTDVWAHTKGHLEGEWALEFSLGGEYVIRFIGDGLQLLGGGYKR